LELRCLPGVIGAHLQLGERAAADSALEACRSFVTEYPSGYGEAVVRLLETTFALLDGRWHEAQARIDETEAYARSVRSAGFLAGAAGQRIWMAFEQGRIDSMLPVLDAVAARFPKLQLVTALRAAAHGRAGRVEPALAALSKVVEGIPEMPHDWN